VYFPQFFFQTSRFIVIPTFNKSRDLLFKLGFSSCNGSWKVIHRQLMGLNQQVLCLDEFGIGNQIHVNWLRN
jgi:hypothetical protein